MATGMLWFDNSDTDLATKIKQAASYYQDKYGETPNLVFIKPDPGQIAPVQVDSIEIRHSRTIALNHFLVCVESQIARDARTRED